MFLTGGGCPAHIPCPNGAPTNDLFLRNPQFKHTVLKRDGGFASQDAAKLAAREDAKKMKNSRQPPACPAGRERPDVERILVGQNAEKATRPIDPGLSPGIF